MLKALWNSSFAPTPKWQLEDIPDLQRKVFIVTGANTGIGRGIAKHLLAHNAKVYIASRNMALVEEAIKELKVETGNEAIALKLELADLHNVKAAAAEFLSKETQLHGLINNAGIMNPPAELLTVQGYDAQFGVNALGPFYFTKLLLPILLSTAQDKPKGTVRIVNVSSLMHVMGELDFNTLKDGPARKKQSLMALYGQSKLANVLFANELARRYGNQGIVSTSLHPGTVGAPSNLERFGLAKAPVWLRNTLMNTCDRGALTPLYAATSPEGAELNGKYLIPWARVSEPRPEALDPKLAEELWAWCEEQVADI